MINFPGLFRASAPLLAETPLSNDAAASSGADAVQDEASQATDRSDSSLEPPSPSDASPASNDEYERLQRRLILATLIATALAVPITALVFDLQTAGSALVGALAGVLYLRLLARSVSKLGNGSKKVGKLQLLVPVVLVMAAARLPQLELLPALLGFLLYKPALIFQAVLDS